MINMPKPVLAVLVVTFVGIVVYSEIQLQKLAKERRRLLDEQIKRMDQMREDFEANRRNRRGLF